MTRSEFLLKIQLLGFKKEDAPSFTTFKNIDPIFRVNLRNIYSIRVLKTKVVVFQAYNTPLELSMEETFLMLIKGLAFKKAIS